MIDRPVLFDACERGDAAMTALLYARGANVNIRDWTGAPPLASLGLGASLTMIKTLLDAGADPEAAGTSMTTALLRFCVLDRRDAVALLLSRGAKANTIGLLGLTPAIAASSVHDLDLLRLLASHGADLRRPIEGGVTALHLASTKEGDAPVLLFLIQHGLDVNGKSSEGDTPLERRRCVWMPGERQISPRATEPISTHAPWTAKL